ncbi:hypothetical protein O9992_09495 [Vibrio lentus]|nr:hypothetical protein [Vibrio lentus]
MTVFRCRWLLGGPARVATAVSNEATKAFVSSVLFALILPPTIPAWQAACVPPGIVVAKEFARWYRDTILNPALRVEPFSTLLIPRPTCRRFSMRVYCYSKYTTESSMKGEASTACE